MFNKSHIITTLFLSVAFLAAAACDGGEKTQTTFLASSEYNYAYDADAGWVLISPKDSTSGVTTSFKEGNTYLIPNGKNADDGTQLYDGFLIRNVIPLADDGTVLLLNGTGAESFGIHVDALREDANDNAVKSVSNDGGCFEIVVEKTDGRCDTLRVAPAGAFRCASDTAGVDSI